MDERDAVAIMGAHTLGETHQKLDPWMVEPEKECCGGSGFTGSWKEEPDTFTFEYFVDSYFLNWKQKPINRVF